MSALVGQPVDRVDGKLKVTGTAPYAAEFAVANVAHAVIIKSTITKGRITAVDTSKAMRAPGIIKVITYENAMSLHFPQSSDPGGGKYAEKDLLPLQSNRIFYDGQIVGLILAETLEQAQYAAKLVNYTYQTEQPAIDLHKNLAQAYKPSKGTGGKQTQLKRGDADAGLQNAPVKVEQTYTTPVYHHNAMEPHATMAKWEGEKLTVYDATQGVAGSKTLLASLLGVQPEKVEVIALYIGGGFGSKGFQWPNTVLAAMAAKQINRPVKLVLSRQDVFTTGGRRSETLQKISLGSNAEGCVSSIKHDTTVESSFVDEFIETAGLATTILYNNPNSDVAHNLVRLNRGTPCPMRAPGESVGTYAIEVAMDELAEHLKIDPLQLRLTNYNEKDLQDDKQFSSKNLTECYKQGADLIGWTQRSAQPATKLEGNYWVGYGMATATYPANRGASTAKAIIYADGRAEFECASQDIGTGTYTVMTQLAADTLSLPISQVKVKLGNSSYPKGANSGGSQVTASVGPAIRAAALGAISKLAKAAIGDSRSPLHNQKEEDLKAENGRLVIAGKPERGESFLAIMNRQGLQKVEALAVTNVSTRQQQEANPASGNGPDEEAQKESKQNAAVQADEKTDRKPYSFHSFGAHFVKVFVDKDFGTVKVDKAVAVMDIGTVMNAKTATNQIMGGMIFGIGMAIMEQTTYDPNRGRIVTKDLAQYLVPVHADMPEFTVKFIEKPDMIISPVGARGIGEIGITGISAAIANAIYNATGKRVRELPISPEKLIS
ncbi:xanthine dehydrogenase family protein molybdopterin-binding subunit [Mucilaginibacter koreensis]